jgi:uncharacterized protein
MVSLSRGDYDMFYNKGSRRLQDQFDTRRIADRLYQVRRHDDFSGEDRELINSAPLFFLATVDLRGRPDCSVKCGAPGFVRVESRNTILFPDYDGNGMFRSLGNISENTHCALLFLDLINGTGRKLRIAGLAELIDNPRELVEKFPGAQLLVRVVAKDIFPNCPRYVPHLSLNENSLYTPRPGYQPPEPEWKSKPDLKPFLPRNLLVHRMK